MDQTAHCTTLTGVAVVGPLCNNYGPLEICELVYDSRRKIVQLQLDWLKIVEWACAGIKACTGRSERLPVTILRRLHRLPGVEALPAPGN